MSNDGGTSQPADMYGEITAVLAKLEKSNDLDYLKSLDKVVQGTDGFSVKKANAEKAIQDYALAALPESAAKTIKKASNDGGGGSLAIELVRRDLTELSVLARALHVSTEEERCGDDGLRRLYNALSTFTELHGALISAGVDVEAKEWAKLLTTKIPNLRQLRSTPWHQVAFTLKLVVPEAGEIDGSVRSTQVSNENYVFYLHLQPIHMFECCSCYSSMRTVHGVR